LPISPSPSPSPRQSRRRRSEIMGIPYTIIAFAATLAIIAASVLLYNAYFKDEK